MLLFDVSRKQVDNTLHKDISPIKPNSQLSMLIDDQVDELENFFFHSRNNHRMKCLQLAVDQFKHLSLSDNMVK